MKLLVILLIVLLYLQLIYAETYSSCDIYGNCPKTTTTTNVNYSSINVNNSNYLQGYQPSNFWKTSEDQTGLTGDKSGTFDLNTSGSINLVGSGNINKQIYYNSTMGTMVFGGISPINPGYKLFVIGSSWANNVYGNLIRSSGSGTVTAPSVAVSSGNYGFYQGTKQLLVTVNGNLTQNWDNGANTTTIYTHLNVTGNVTAPNLCYINGNCPVYNSSYNNLLNQNCPNGYVVNGTYANGTIKCTAQSASSGTSLWENTSTYVYPVNGYNVYSYKSEVGVTNKNFGSMGLFQSPDSIFSCQGTLQSCLNITSAARCNDISGCTLDECVDNPAADCTIYNGNEATCLYYQNTYAVCQANYNLCYGTITCDSYDGDGNEAACVSAGCASTPGSCSGSSGGCTTSPDCQGCTNSGDCGTCGEVWTPSDCSDPSSYPCSTWDNTDTATCETGHAGCTYGGYSDCSTVGSCALIGSNPTDCTALTGCYNAPCGGTILDTDCGQIAYADCSPDTTSGICNQLVENDTTTLIAKAGVGQTSNILNITDSSDNTNCYFDYAGQLNCPTGVTTLYNVQSPYLINSLYNYGTYGQFNTLTYTKRFVGTYPFNGACSVDGCHAEQGGNAYAICFANSYGQCSADFSSAMAYGRVNDPAAQYAFAFGTGTANGYISVAGLYGTVQSGGRYSLSIGEYTQVAINKTHSFSFGFNFINNETSSFQVGFNKTNLKINETNTNIYNNFTVVNINVSTDAQATNLIVTGNFSAKRPYGMYSSTQTQSVAVINTAYPMTFNYTENSYYITKAGDNANFSFIQKGEYLIKLRIIAQGGQGDRAEIWVQKNGANVPRSNTIYDFKGNNTNEVIAVPFIIETDTTDKFRVMYAGSSTNVKLQYTTNTSYSPETPSAIMTITKISDKAP